jgi:cytidine deaminase
MKDDELIRCAMEARNMAYAPYSDFLVGAALLADDGKVYTGCNIENASFTPTICAERTAMFKAISEGKYKFKKIAIVGSPKGELTQFAYPCGVCRQVMMEFVNPQKFQILVAKSEHEFQTYALEELLPNGFGPNNINNS